MTLAVAGFVIICTNFRLQADLISNGSFETPLTFAGGFTNFGTGSTGITAWTVVGPSASIVSGTYTAGCCRFPAEDGVQWLDLTGDVSNAVEGVQQIVATTPGTSYTLSYWVGNVNDPTGVFGRTSSVRVLLNGTLLDTATNSISSTTLAWERFTDVFTATTTASIIEFLNNDPTTDNSNGLDNVSLNVTGNATVPEPGTLTVCLVSLAGLCLLFRRQSTTRPSRNSRMA